MLIKKFKETNQDPFWALLELRSMPQQFNNKSPAEILLGRKPRTLLPFSKKAILHEPQQSPETKTRVC